MTDRRSEPGAFFGAPWPSGICDTGFRVSTPEDEPCGLCDEPIVEGQQGSFMNGGQVPVHRECSLRSVLGGIGHHEDHQLWCVERRDPDGGRSYRQSALEVWSLIAGRPWQSI